MAGSCEIYGEGGMLVVKSPYDPAFVAALKARIPSAARRWDRERRAWLVDVSQRQAVVHLAEQHFGDVRVQLGLLGVKPQDEVRLLEVRYLGRAKARGSGERTAFAWVDGGWNAVFPERVLRRWFDGTEGRPGDAPSLYQVLGIPAGADAVTIKRAYRRMVKQWHPDVCREPDAAEQFQAIQRAYEILSDAAKRAKYDAGLALAATLPPAQQDTEPQMGYRAPLRCGRVMCRGHEMLGRFVVSEILAWEDIVDTQGRVLVSSWPPGEDHFVEVWR